MRICSLLPSSTEIAFALGLGDHIVGVTHECDHPPEARTKPVVTRSAISSEGMTSSEIEQAVHRHLHQGSSIYRLDMDLIRELKPDLILTQELCDVCAVSYRQVREAARILEGEVRVISLEPSSLEDILDNIRVVGEATGRQERARRLIAELQERIDRIARVTQGLERRHRVFCMEWLDPPYNAGHWVQEMAELAGGHEGLAPRRQPSTRVSWEKIVRYAPEVVVLMPCGFTVERVLQEIDRVTSLPGWKELPAAQSGRVFAVNGSAYFNRPGPRIVNGLEILAEIFHPEHFSGLIPPGAAERVATS